MDDKQAGPHGGRLITAFRVRAGLTQEALAERAHVSRSMIAQIERGQRRPSRKLVKALSEALGIRHEDESELLAAYDFLPAGDTPEQIIALLRADKNLTSEQQVRLAALITEAYRRETKVG